MARGSGPRREGVRRPPEASGTATARRRLARVTDLLEREYGVPTSAADPDLVGSLVATILSQNTSDVNSGRAYETLRERFADWDAVSRARVKSIESAIKSGGLAGIKARRIREILREIESRTGRIDLGFLRDMPTEDVVRYLRGFNGVGSKTAACVALFDLGREIMPVDTHVHRVVGRLGVVGRPRAPDDTYEALQRFIPRGKSLSLHVNLIRLGRSRCRPRTPACDRCPLRRLCDHGRRKAV